VSGVTPAHRAQGSVRKLLWLIIATAAILVAGEELYRSGWVRFNYPNPQRFPVRGIDVSHHQGPIDWVDVRRAGIAFAFIKASEGGDHRDSRFPANWEAAAEAGVARGAYHFFTFCRPGLEQAEHFIATVSASIGELPPAADVEFSGNCAYRGSIEAIRRELSAFLEKVEVAFDRRPALYLTEKSYDRIAHGHFPGYPLWVRSIVFEPSPRRFFDWAFWQYADNGRLPGIDHVVDLNTFHGTRAEFDAMIQRETR
jgi:lysozyme